MDMHRKFGWKPSLPDPRDFKYKCHPEMAIHLQLPSMVDLRVKMSPIEDQGQLGSCVAHATAGVLECLELQELKDKESGKEVFEKGKFIDISRLFIYYNARAIDGDPNHDNGTHLRSAMKAVRKWGICREALWAYNQAMVNASPAVNAYKEAYMHKLLSYYSLNHQSLGQLKQCLALGYPFIFGISVFESFMSEAVAQSGIVPMPDASEGMMGGHALCCVGYDDSKSAFIVRNSWSDHWGMSGYCYIPFEYLTSSDLASDFWTLRKE